MSGEPNLLNDIGWLLHNAGAKSAADVALHKRRDSARLPDRPNKTGYGQALLVRINMPVFIYVGNLPVVSQYICVFHYA